MNIPHSRLLWLIALIVLPLSITSAIVLQNTTPALLLLFLLMIVAFLDFALSWNTSPPIKIQVPGVVRLTVNQPGNIPFTIENTTRRKVIVSFSPDWPEGLGLKEEIQVLKLDKFQLTWEQPWNGTPEVRGKWKLENIYLEWNSLLKFWRIRKTQPLQCEVRVYPNLHDEQHYSAFTFLKRGQLGVHAYPQIGKGREFEMLREYQPGDSYEDIYWKATARHQQPITKVFQIERTQEIYVILDHSRLSARAVHEDDTASLKRRLLDRYIVAAIMLHHAAHHQSDRFGLITFSNQVTHFVRARAGKNHYRATSDSLYALEPETVSPDFEELLTFIRLRLRKRSLLIFLTNLDDPVLAESLLTHLPIISRQHHTLINLLEPFPLQPLFSGHPVSNTDEIYQRMGSHMLWSQISGLQKKAAANGVSVKILKNESLCGEVVDQYMQVKQRQLI